MRGALACAILALACAAPAEATSPRAARAAFLKQLDRPRVPLDPVVAESVPGEGVVTERLSIASEKRGDRWSACRCCWCGRRPRGGVRR